MLSSLLWIPIVAGVSGWVQDTNAGQLAVRALSVTDHRFVDLVKPKEDKDENSFTFSFNDNEPALTIMIEVKGPATTAATHFGFVKFDKAAADQGPALKPLKPMAQGFGDPREEFVEIDRDMMFMGEPDPPQDVLKFGLRFEPPARNATKIVAIEGALKLQTGTRKDVLVADPGEKFGKMVEDETLKKLGVHVKILDPAKSEGFFGASDPEKAVTIEVGGDLDAILEAALVDGAGEKLNASTMSGGMGETKNYVFESDEPLPKDVRLRLTVVTDKKEVEVPIRLKDVPLP